MVKSICEMIKYSELIYSSHLFGSKQVNTMFKTRHVQSNTEELSSIHCCKGKVTSITYFECVSLALVIQHRMRMRRFVICGLSGSTTFFHIISDTEPFSKKGLLNTKCVF
jgi:hypothetical protein